MARSLTYTSVSIMRLLIIIFRGFKGVCKASQCVWEIPVTGSRLWAFILARYIPLPPKMAQVSLRYPIHSIGARSTSCCLRRSFLMTVSGGIDIGKALSLCVEITQAKMKANSCPSIFIFVFSLGLSHRWRWSWRWHWRWRVGSIRRSDVAVVICLWRWW